MRPRALCAAALAVSILAFGSAAQAPPDASEGSRETILLSEDQARDVLLLTRCVALGNVRLRLSHGGPDGLRRRLTQELRDTVRAMIAFVRELGLHYEDVAVVLFEGRWRYKTETPPAVWKHLMEKQLFTFDPKHFAIIYESVCAPGYDPAEDIYDVTVLKDRLAKARSVLTKPAVDR